MTDLTSSRSSSRAPSILDPDPATMPSATSSASAPKESSGSSHSTATTSTKRDDSQTNRSSNIVRGNLSTSGPFNTTLSGFQSLHSSRSPSAAASPRSSRDSSPAGLAFRHASAGNSMSFNSGQIVRARKNSTEVSPQRSQAVPKSQSAVAIQRTLSQTAPQLQPAAVSDPNSRIPRSQKTTSGEGKDAPSWPISPRLKSPSPRRNSMRSLKKSENGNASDIATRTASPAGLSDATNHPGEQSNLSTKASASRLINGSGLTLETVQESSVPPTPSEEPSRASSEERKSEYFSFAASDHEQDRPLTARQDSTESLDQLTPRASNTKTERKKEKEKEKESSSLESSGDFDSNGKLRLMSKSSPTKSELKSGVEPTLKNMTVETETVSSVPQATLGPPADRSVSGRNEQQTIRVKASTETIRPRKERKKATKKAPSINAASSSTRAEIFEDRVKNAMDEATSDDSDETFVYESNPPEPQPKRSRNHSRTPSGASLSSMQDRSVMRSIANAIEQHRTVPKTRSMKFASNTSNYGTADEEGDNRDGTIRASQRNGTASALQHHFRRERQVTGQQVIPDEESNSVPLSKTKSLTAVGGRGSYAARLAAQNLRHTSTMKRNDGYATLDMEADAADDERTPLMGTVRTPNRGNRSIRGTRYPRYLDPRVNRRDRGGNILARFAGCFLILITISILSFGVVCFLFAMSKPLSKVAVVELSSVIASEQELMLDVMIQAINPNLVPITMMDLDINLFARSEYAGSERWWTEHGMPPPQLPVSRKEAAISSQVQKRDTGQRRTTMIPKVLANIGIPDTPSSKPDNSTTGPTLLLGNITHFDNPLTFDGSFWRRQIQWSKGSIRLSKPGNTTEAAGTERWEHVLKHDFELLVRGVVRYNIPLGGRTIAVPINGEVPVKGTGGKDDDHDDKDIPSGGEDQWLVKYQRQTKR